MIIYAFYYTISDNGDMFASQVQIAYMLIVTAWLQLLAVKVKKQYMIYGGFFNTLLYSRKCIFMVLISMKLRTPANAVIKTKL